MYALVVTIQVQPAHLEEFIKASLEDAKGSIQNEPNCLRFDILQDLEDPNRIHLYEVYREEADHLSHREQPHYIKWRDATQDWREGEPIRRRSNTVFPADSDWKK